MSGSAQITKVIVGFLGAKRLARYRQIKISVLGKKSRGTRLPRDLP
jgi:hypothetical protein